MAKEAEGIEEPAKNGNQSVNVNVHVYACHGYGLHPYANVHENENVPVHVKMFSKRHAISKAEHYMVMMPTHGKHPKQVYP